MESKFPRALKFDDFERDPNLVNVDVDLVGIISKVGKLKYANSQGANENEGEKIAIRDLQVYDDTFTMVRLILRYNLAEECETLKVDDIISLKNVRVVKLQNRFIMTASQNTIIDVNADVDNVLWLKQWFNFNRKELVRNDFAQFNNLSMTPAKPKKEREENQQQTSTPQESPPAKLLRLTPTTINAFERIEENSREREENQQQTSASQESPPEKFLRLTPTTINALERIEESSRVNHPLSSPSSPIDSKADFINDNNKSLSALKSQENTRKENIHIRSDNESDIKTNNKIERNEDVSRENDVTDEVKKGKCILEKVETDTNETDNIKKDVRFETYHTLMCSPLLKNDWGEEQDQYLVNFITKNSYDLQSDLVYNKLLIEMPDIFAQTSLAMLKQRVLELSAVKNYLYLMKLCGGDHLTTEKEKSTFIIKVEKLRESMKLITIS